MKALSDAAKRAIGDTIDSVTALISSAENALGEDLGGTNFAMNVLANVMAKFILTRAAATCAVLANGDAPNIKALARLEAANVIVALPTAIRGFIDANAASMVEVINLLDETNEAAAKGIVQ